MELSELRAHLDGQFERQEALLQALALELRQLPRQVSESSNSTLLPTTSRVIALPDSRTRELEEHMQLQRGTLMSSQSPSKQGVYKISSYDIYIYYSVNTFNNPSWFVSRK